MQILVWSGLFFLLSVGGSAIELVGLVGLPIAPDIYVGIVALAGVVVASGIALAASLPPALAPDPCI